MTAKKSAPRRKRGVPAPSGPKKKQTVAAKKKHVRELAKIERLYGKKIVAKAKTYAENHRVTKTPQEIAREILLKNGYVPSAPQAAASTTPAQLVDQVVEPSARGNLPRVDATAHTTFHSSSPETLTKEQQELIEMRRREALERRRRVQQAGIAHVHPPAVIRPDPAEDMRRGLHQAAVPVQELHHPSLQASIMVSSRPAVQPRSKTHRVVTPENIPTANQAVETEHARPEYFWDDLEAAAEIVQWENEHMAEVALDQPPAKTPRDFNREIDTVQHSLQHQMKLGKPKTRPPAIPSLSQELLAAAEIIQWEKEHEVSPEVPAVSRPVDSSDSDHELDAPQFQLLPVQVTDEFEQHKENVPESVRPRVNNVTSRHALPSNNSQAKSKARRKRPLVAAPPPALRRSSALSTRVAKAGGENQRHSTSSYPSHNQRDPTTEFIDKHLLEDKLEYPVLEFLDMMLA